MIKTVRTTIFVLSLLLLIRASTVGVLAAPNIKACRQLANISALLPATKPQQIKPLSLYLPIQQEMFIEQKSMNSYATTDIPNPGFTPEVGESEVTDALVAEAKPIAPTDTPAAPLQVTQVENPQNDGSLNAETLFAMVNTQRANAGLSPVVKDDRVCSIASTRGPELYNDIMVTHTMHAGFYAMNLPYWASEIVIYMHTEQEAINWWMNSPIHRAQIMGDYKYACGTCAGRACDIIFTNFTPKQSTTSI